MPYRFWLSVLLATSGLLLTPASTRAQTVQGDILRGEGCYLRGLGWYNFNTAQANAINVDAMIRWKEDLRKISQERLALQSRKELGKKLRGEELQRRQLQRQRELRVSPTAAQVQSGEALNALLYDLTDPSITSEVWQSHSVPLPKDLSVKALVFQFMPLTASSASSKALSRGVIALSRLDTSGNWPTVLKFDELNAERDAYDQAYTRLQEQVLNGNFDLAALSAVDTALENLKQKVKTSVPTERGFRGEATRFVDDLINATRFFDAATVDYAQEILIDTNSHNATTVAELVAFTLKYRLQFASADRSADSRVLYGQLYESFAKQAKVLGIEPPEAPPEPPAQPEAPADAVEFGGKKYKVYSEQLTWKRAQLKAVELGGNLVAIESDEENVFVTALAAAEKLEHVWIGAHDEQKEGWWTWPNGEELTYTNWANAQPNNFKGNENYAELFVIPNFQRWKNRAGQWNDLPDVHLPGFVCEWD